MTSKKVTAPYTVIIDSNGLALESGKIYIGINGSDPEANPQTVYFDSSLSTPASQPVRTINGYISNAGSPADLFTANNYSITVRDKNDVLIYTKLTNDDGADPLYFLSDYATLADALTAIGSDQVTLIVSGAYTVADDATIPSNITLLFYQSGYLSISNTKVVTFDKCSVQASENTHIFQGQGTVTGPLTNPSAYVGWWGAKGDGVTDDILSLDLAVAWMKSTDGNNLAFSSGNYATTSVLNIGTSSGYKNKIDGNHCTIISTSTGIVVDFNASWENCFFENFKLESTTAHTIMKTSGQFVFRSTFRNLYILGDTVTNATKHGLLIYGANNYYNVFDNIEIRQASYGISIGYDHENATASTYATTPNANKFSNIDIGNHDVDGLYLYQTVGNMFVNLDIHENIAGAANHINLVSSAAGQVTKSNYFLVRAEGSTAQDVTIGQYCENNFFDILVDGVFSYFSTNERRQTSVRYMGGNGQFSAEGVSSSYFRAPSGSQMTLFDGNASASLIFSGSDFSAAAADHNQIDLGKQTTAEFKNAWLAGTISFEKAVSDLISTKLRGRMVVQNQTNNAVGHIGQDTWVTMADGESFTVAYNVGGLFSISEDGIGYAGVFASSYESSTITVLSDPGSRFDVTDVDNNKIAVFTAITSETLTIKNYTGSDVVVRFMAYEFVSGATAPI